VALERIDYQPAVNVAFHPAQGATTGHDPAAQGSNRDGYGRQDPFENLAVLTDHVPGKSQHLLKF
jgi:hypothetical protein